MAGKVLATSRVAREVFEEGSDTLGLDLKFLACSATIEQLSRMENAQPAILATSVAYFRQLREQYPELKPHFLAGHSLGEYTALVAAGALSFRDALKIVYKRTALMQQAVPAGEYLMCAINDMAAEKVLEMMREVDRPGAHVSVSGFNAAFQTVISGNREAVEKAAWICEKAGAQTSLLRVSTPSHTPLMEPAAHGLERELQQYTFAPLSAQVIANLDGLPYRSSEELVSKLPRQLMSPVRWRNTIRYIIDNKGFYFLEVGPGKVLKNLLREYAGVERQAIDEDNSEGFIRRISESIRHVSTVVTRCLAIATATRNTNWNEKAYQAGVAGPFQAMRRLQLQLEKEERMPSGEENAQALSLLRGILQTKGLASADVQRNLQEALQ